MRVGIIGYGSIGKRHAKNLISLNINDIILFREVGKANDLGLKEVNSLSDLLLHNPDFVIVANPTAKHYSYLKELILKQINIFVEKPIVSNYNEVTEIEKLIDGYKGIGFTALNMRFHPCVSYAYNLQQSGRLGKLQHARFFVGQYLPDWRPGNNYTKSYSASKSLGGGVLLDLIHEIDLAILFAGSSIKSISSYVGKIGDLKIETEDIAEITYLTSEKVLVNIHLDYITRGYKRYFQLFFEKGWINVDLYFNSVDIYEEGKGINTISYTNFDRNKMYQDELSHYINSILINQQPNITLYNGLQASSLVNRIINNNCLL